MFICVNDPSLNRDLGKYQLPHIWDNILQDTPALQAKQSNLSPPHYWHYPQVPKPPPNSSLPIQAGAHVHFLVSIQMGEAKHPLCLYTPFLCSTTLPYTAMSSR